MILVSRPYLPPREVLDRYLDRIYRSGWLSNNGPLVQELTERLSDYLGVNHLQLVANGTLALQIAFRALSLKGNVVTTPFTFAATSAALAWEGLSPVYAEIDQASLNLDPQSAAAACDGITSAILPVHAYGNPCDVEAFGQVSQAEGLKVIYDASHTFGVLHKEKALVRWGDAATLSFHATKLFHTGEGGGIVFADKTAWEKARRIVNFGLEDGIPKELGINAKMSEFHAALGLANLENIDRIIERRLEIQYRYRRHLEEWLEFPVLTADTRFNGAYMPILLSSRKQRDEVRALLAERGFDSRPYFYPTLDSLGIYSEVKSSLSGGMDERVLCLPIYFDLQDESVDAISDGVIDALRKQA